MEVALGLFVSGGNAPELLGLIDAAFHEVTFAIKIAVKGMLERARWIVRDDRQSTGVERMGADLVGVVGSIRENNLRRSAVNER